MLLAVGTWQLSAQTSTQAPPVSSDTIRETQENKWIKIY